MEACAWDNEQGIKRPWLEADHSLIVVWNCRKTGSKTAPPHTDTFTLNFKIL
jgi:hypothetical protein